MPLSEFELNLGPVGRGSTVKVNGEEVQHVRALQVSAEVDEVTKLVLVTMAEGTIRGEGIVEVHVLDDRLLQMLDQMDPGELEAEALQRLEWGGGGVVAQVLQILKERLSADQPDRSPASSGAPAPG